MRSRSGKLARMHHVLKAPAIGALLLLGPLALAGGHATAKLDLDAFERSKQVMHLSDGVDLAYLERGDRTGPAVVLIHGYTDSAIDWAPLVPELPPRWHLIIVDIRGHGRSSKPECCYDRLDFAYDIKLLLDGLKISSADIVGHSLGSIIAQTFGEYWPERTRRIVLISSTGGWPPDVPRNRPQLDYAAEIRKLKEPLDPGSPFMRAWWDSPTPVDPELNRRQREAAARIPLRVWLAVLDEALPQDRDYADLQSTLPRLGEPTLLIWGSRDPIMEEPVRQSLQKALPHAQVKIFEGLGHNPFWEDPAGVAQLIENFLSSSGA